MASSRRLLAGERRGDADVVQLAAVVEQSEQQRTDHRIPAVLVPAESGDDAVGGARVLDLDHRPLARLVAAVVRLGHHAVQAGAFESRQPVDRGRAVAGHRRHMNRRRDVGERALERPPALGHRLAAQVLAVERQQIERHERGRRRLRELGDARCGRMQPQLQRVEVEPFRRRDHDLAVDDAVGRKSGEQRVVQLGEVAIERPQVAALHEQVACPAKHDRPEAVPFRLEKKRALFRQHVRQLREHGLDRGRDRKSRVSHLAHDTGADDGPHLDASAAHTVRLKPDSTDHRVALPVQFGLSRSVRLQADLRPFQR